MTTEPTIGQLTEHVRDNGPTRVRHDGQTYEVTYFGTFSFDTKEDR